MTQAFKLFPAIINDGILSRQINYGWQNEKEKTKPAENRLEGKKNE